MTPTTCFTLRRSSWAIALSLGLLAGCSLLPSVGPDKPPALRLQLPENWRTPQTAPTLSTERLADWWHQLDDPILDKLIATALTDSRDLALAQARLRQARASRLQASAAYFPTLSASTAASRNKTSAAIQSSPQRTLYDAGFDASWEIDIFGGTRRAVEAATADLATTQANADNTRVSLVAEVAQNYLDLRSYQQRLRIAQANLRSQSETVQITEWRNQAGLANSSDVEQARTSREQTRASLPDLEIGLTAAENRLTTLLGKNPGALHADLAEPKPLPEVPASLATGIPADVLRQRPDLLAAESTLAAETARVGQTLAQRFPSLNLAGSFGWQAYSTGALGTAGTTLHALTGTLATTLFDGGRLRAAVEIQNAIQEQALISYENSVLTALEEVENALTAHAASHERLEARRAAATAARNAADLTRKLYESGLTDFQKVLETERTRLTAEDNQAQAEATRLSSLIKLYKTLGGGWQSSRVAQLQEISRP